MARSHAFYREVLGFEEGESLAIDDQYHALLGVTGSFSLRSQFLRLGGLVIELLDWSAMREESAGLLPLYRVGLTHLSFEVDDLDATLTKVTAFGGTVLHDSRSTFALPHMSGEVVFVTDPDGVRIELNAFPAPLYLGGRSANDEQGG
ncbi:glyoxalase/bleomycin resistance protein/dioxygenase [Sphingobium sp. MI1205]|nr:glyoxalase/bleomycin resistance protein/dioxygenase [Sphingobium sp. MI1205]